MRLEHHLVGGYVRYISPYIIIIIIITFPLMYIIDSKRVSILIEAVFPNITNVVPSL